MFDDSFDLLALLGPGVVMASIALVGFARLHRGQVTEPDEEAKASSR